MCMFEVVPSATGDPMPRQKKTKVPNDSFMIELRCWMGIKTCYFTEDIDEVTQLL